VTDQANLERGYRRLLAWYPRAFRRENGQEILAVLMACAPDGQRRPGLAESADLIRSGLWMRLRPSVPRSAPTVRAAVKLMYAGAAVPAVYLIIVLAYLGADGMKAVRVTHRANQTAAQVSGQKTLVITVAIASLLVMTALWLWMARANGQGRNWARILSTVLFGLATLNLTSVFGPPGWRIGVGDPGTGGILSVLIWLVGLAAVWLLWRRASSAFFKPPGVTQAGHSAQPPSRIRPPHVLPPRQL
jgi:hypothetical protein